MLLGFIRTPISQACCELVKDSYYLGFDFEGNIEAEEEFLNTIYQKLENVKPSNALLGIEDSLEEDMTAFITLEETYLDNDCLHDYVISEENDFESQYQLAKEINEDAESYMKALESVHNKHINTIRAKYGMEQL